MSDSGEDRSPLLDVLSVGPVGVTSPVEVGRAREKMLPWLEQQVAEVPMQRSVKRQRESWKRRVAVLSGGVALAAAALLVFHLGSQETPNSGGSLAKSDTPLVRETATLVTGQLRSSSHTWLGGQEVSLVGRLSAGAEGAALQADRGYQLELRPASEVSFERLSGNRLGANKQESLGIHLHQGLAKISVLPLPQGSELVVKTGDVLLTVVKAAFTVEANSRSSSCLRVTEGEVVVWSGGERSVVSSGEDFGCSESPPLGVEASLPNTQKKSASAPRTTLSQENDLLSRALSAESRGQMDQARSAYEELLSKYPRSAFAQDARAGLARLSH